MGLLVAAACLLAGCGGGSSSTPIDLPEAARVIQTWYVDAQDGDDAAAGNEQAPWRTLGRAARQALLPGDQLLLKCGGVFRESFNLDVSNAAGGGARLAAWGACNDANRPVINGASVLQGLSWTRLSPAAGGAIHVAPWAAPVQRLFWNGVPLVRARYPNYAGVGSEFSLIAEVRGAGTLLPAVADAVALGDIDLSGARLYVRTNPWLVEAIEVASGRPSSGLVPRTAGRYPLQPGQGWAVEGKLSLLDQPGEWFHDLQMGRLYVWLPGDVSPDQGLLETVERSVGLSISGGSAHRVDRIAFANHAEAAVRVHGAPRTVLDALLVQYPGPTGILIEDDGAATSEGSRVLRSRIEHAGRTAILLRSTGLLAQENVVDATGIAHESEGISAGIRADSTGSTLVLNRVLRSGFAGVLLNQASEATVAGNHIEQACLRLSDCGGIYSAGAPRTPGRSTLRANAIVRMTANLQGAVGSSVDLVSGIYLDERSARHDVLDNLVARTSVGVTLHNSADNLVQGNKIWLVQRSSIRAHNSSASDTLRGNTVQNNLLYAAALLDMPKDPGRAPVLRYVFSQEWIHSQDAVHLFAGASPNVVRRNQTSGMHSAQQFRWSLISGMQQRVLTSAEWATLAADETLRVAYEAASFRAQPTGANLFSNPTLQAPGQGWQFASPVPSAGGSLVFGTCGAGCADLTSGTDGDIASSGSFTVDAAAGRSLYWLSLRVTGLAGPGTVAISVGRDRPNYESLGLARAAEPIAGAGDTRLDFLFNATATGSARLNVAIPVARPLRIKEAALVPVSRYQVLDPLLESELLTNPGIDSVFVTCPAVLRICDVVDLDGRQVSWPVALAPGAGLVVVSGDARWRAAP